MQTELTITGKFSVFDKEYNGTTAAEIDDNELELIGVEDDHDVYLIDVVVEFITSDAGNSITVKIIRADLGGDDAGNYTLSLDGAPTALAYITARDLTLGNFTANNKIYDGTTDVEGTDFSDDRLDGDDLEFDYDAEFEDKNVGTGKTVRFTNINISGGADAGNYSLATTSGQATADITAKQLTITGTFTADDKIYDGTTDATIEQNNLTLVGVESGDNVTLINLVVEFASENAGSGITVNITSADLGGTDAGNYTLSLDNAPTALADITKKELTIGGSFTASSKQYDGTTDATIDQNNLTLSGVESGDNVTLTDLVVEFAGENAGTNIPVSIISAGLTGPDAENYTLSLEDAPASTANITPRGLTLTSFTAANKVYDGTTDVTGTGFDDDRIEGDDLEFDYDAAFEDGNAGTGKIVNFTNITISGGADQDNYTLVTTEGQATANITAKILTLSNFIADNKVYDGTTDVEGTDFEDNRLDGDELEFSYNAAFANKNVGTAKDVNFTGISISGGADMDNYNLVTTSGVAKADITPRDLTLSNFTASNKQYDGNTIVTGTGFDDDRLDGDTFGFSYTAAFEDKNAGTGKIVNFTNITISGADQNNYTLVTTTAQITANITKKPITIAGSFTAHDKIYDGTTDASINQNNLTLSGVVPGDNVTLTGLVVEFASANVGTDISVSIIGAALAGTDAGNYTLSIEGAPTATASISLSPVLSDAQYNSSTGNLLIVGENLRVDQDVIATKLTVSNGIHSYTFSPQTDNVRPSSSTQATLVVEGREKAFMNWIFNNNGLRSKDNQVYTLTAAENWNGPALEGQTSQVAVSNFSAPSIVSAVYNRLQSELDVTATRLAAAPGHDIDATQFTISGKDGGTHTLTSATQNVNVLSETRFAITISEADQAQVDQLIDIQGTTSSSGHPYNLAAANSWNIPVHPDYNIADLTGNPIEAVEIPNNPPQALNVEITGSPEIGNTVTGSYDWFDPEGDPKDNSEYAWYRANDDSGSGETKINGADQDEYTVTLDDAAKYLAFEVTPKALVGARTGETVRSDWVEVVNSPPSASNVEITGTLEVCKVLTVTYDYFDPEGDPQGDPIIKWFRADNDAGANEQQMHEGLSYTLTIDEEDKYIRVEVTPVATEGTPEGTPVSGGYYGPVENKLPTVSITGPAEICQGLEINISFELTGRGPWTVYYTDGTGQYDFTATDSPYMLGVSSGGTYRVTSIVDAEGCEGVELGEELVLRGIPTVLIEDWYIEAFGGASSEWISAAPSGDMVNSWTFGQPDGDIFTSASAGGNIWYTKITDNSIAQQSWVASPCFDFSQVKRPMIAIDLWKKFGQNSDGAVLQYSINNEKIWENIGKVDQGINWYNSSQIAGMPGGQQTGWTETGQGWTETKHDLDAVAGQNFVRFRIAYGSDGSQQTQGGVAFDNIRIGERKRLVLLEHFTNANDGNSIAANQIVHDVAVSQKYDIAYISYHTSFPTSDPINSQNTADPAARALYYGVSSVPFSILDGGLEGQGRYDYSSSVFNRNDLVKRALADHCFTIGITQNQAGNLLDMEVEVSSTCSIGPLDLTLHVAILETEVAASLIGLQGDAVFRNVVRKLKPDAGGTPLQSTWRPDQPQSYNFDWTIENVLDAENLAVIAFIQDENTREVYQVGASSQFGVPTFVDLPNQVDGDKKVVFYPNPATDNLFIQFKENLAGDHILEVFNLSGNMVRTDILKEGSSSYQFNTAALTRGIYLFRIKNNRGIVATERIVVMN